MFENQIFTVFSLESVELQTFRFRQLKSDDQFSIDEILLINASCLY